MRSSATKRLLIGLGVVAALVVIGPFVYINFVSDDAPPPLSLDTGPTTTLASSQGAVEGPSSNTEPLTSLDGTWSVTDGSEAGYRVVEVLFGQDNIAAGRTSDVTGDVTVDGTTVQAAEVSVDLTTVTSDDNRRDNQFRGRIMNTSRFPNAIFVLTEPVSLAGLPEDGVDMSATASGELTLRGETQPVTAALTFRRTGATVAVLGNIDIVFNDFGIPDPSVPGITTRDNGTLEFLLNFAKS